MKLYCFGYCDGWNIEDFVVCALSLCEAVWELARYTDEDFKLKQVYNFADIKMTTILGV
jgi:hypothetical protein